MNENEKRVRVATAFLSLLMASRCSSPNSFFLLRRLSGHTCCCKHLTLRLAPAFSWWEKVCLLFLLPSPGIFFRRRSSPLFNSGFEFLPAAISLSLSFSLPHSLFRFLCSMYISLFSKSFLTGLRPKYYRHGNKNPAFDSKNEKERAFLPTKRRQTRCCLVLLSRHRRPRRRVPVHFFFVMNAEPYFMSRESPQTNVTHRVRKLLLLPPSGP